MHSSIVIEFASRDDAVEIAEMSRMYIEYDLGWEYTPERIATLIRDQKRNVVVAREDGKIAGFGIMTYLDKQANLDLLAVRLRYRYRGMGCYIVRWLEEVALTAGIFRITVQVRKINAGAIKFYQRAGYRILSEQPGYYRGKETAVFMSRDLRKKS